MGVCSSKSRAAAVVEPPVAVAEVVDVSPSKKETPVESKMPAAVEARPAAAAPASVTAVAPQDAAALAAGPAAATVARPAAAAPAPPAVTSLPVASASLFEDLLVRLERLAQLPPSATAAHPVATMAAPSAAQIEMLATHIQRLEGLANAPPKAAAAALPAPPTTSPAASSASVAPAAKPPARRSFLETLSESWSSSMQRLSSIFQGESHGDEELEAVIMRLEAVAGITSPSPATSKGGAPPSDAVIEQLERTLGRLEQVAGRV